MLENTEEIAELVTEDVVNVAKEIVKVTKNNYIIITGVAFVSISAGLFAGYMFCKKKLKMKFDEDLEKEIESAKHYFTVLRGKDKYATPEEAVAELVPEPLRSVQAADAVLRYQGNTAPVKQYNKPVVVVEEIVVESQSKLVIESDGFNYADELPNRSPDNPYVISSEEFMENETDFVQSSLTYYAYDDVLVDERESPIEDVDGTVGNDNLQRFGHGSKDPNIVYVRNENLDLDFEIVRNNLSYAKHVLGFVEHSSRTLRRFRQRDDE